MQERIENIEALERFAEKFVRGLFPRTEGATLVTLSGELGAGKTAFTKSVAKVLGVAEVVTSPTFVLEKIYALPAPRSGAGFTRLIHIDAYRLDSGADLAPLGFDELMRDSGNLILLEWPEKVMDALPVPATALRFETLSDGTRTISTRTGA